MVKIKALLAKITAKLVTLDTATTVTTGSGTVNSGITASRKRCDLIKVGNVVHINMGLGNITAGVTTSTNLYTIPSAYRPSSTITVSGYVDDAMANFTIRSDGGIRQSLKSSPSNILLDLTYTL